jgi:DNA-binding SARP family transcriptional activator
MTKELGILSTKNVLFHLYGSVEASVDGVRIGLGTEKERRMIVPLLLTIRRPVSYLELADWMWDGSPSSAPDDLGRYMGDFRARLVELGLRGALVNRDRVCRLNVLPAQVDAHRLAAVLAEAERVDDRTAAGKLREALALCAGEPLAGLSGHRIDGCRQNLLEDRRRAQLMLIRVEFRLGHAAHRLPALMRLFRDRPEDTEVATLAMRGLAGAGRQAEALGVFRRCCERLIELGMKVPPGMAELHLRILRDELAIVGEARELERHG